VRIEIKLSSSGRFHWPKVRKNRLLFQKQRISALSASFGIIAANRRTKYSKIEVGTGLSKIFP
jgi:transposase